MAKFLTKRGVASEIENIINGARSSLVLISPYVKIPESLLQNLINTNKRKVNITLVYGKDELKPEVRSQLEQLDNLSLRFLENLHAKCFFNEESMVITSMNLHDFSEQHNREMGIKINVKEDGQVFSDALREANLIIDESKKYDLQKPKVREGSKEHSTSPKATSKSQPAGCCIRCRTSIPINAEKQLYHDCYSKWAEYKNPDYEENYCHACGKPTPTTKGHPLCYRCFKVLFG